MKSVIKFMGFIFFCSALICFSCQKELSCEDCQVNKPPVANAGKDTTIILPVDSISLDGSASKDPDGSIKSWLWTKISGPSFFNFVNDTASRTIIKNLAAGVYQFQLKVTDDGGLSAKDTVIVIVNSVVATNHPPTAVAGKDTTIIFPANTGALDGAGSIDPDNNITSYTWVKISGPSLFTIEDVNAVQTHVTNLVQGIYQFELTVTDAGGLMSKDTVQVTVDVDTALTNCPVIPAQLIPLGTLSFARSNLVTASVGNKIIFTGDGTTRVDMYDINANSWTIGELSIARQYIVTATVGNKIFFAGGDEGYGVVSTRVDIYDADNNTWSVAELSQGRSTLSAATVGNKILFAGGYNSYLINGGSDRVDIYDNSTGTWSTASLSRARWGLSAITTGDKIYFAGGEARNAGGGGIGGANIVNTVDIYDAITDTWSTSALGEARGYMPGIFFDGKIYWAGGASSISTDYTFSSNVEIMQVSTNISSYVQLCSSPIAGYNAVAARKDNSILFFPGYNFGSPTNKFAIYNITSNTWSMGLLDKKLNNAAFISVGSKIYVAGGDVNGILTNQVWTLEF